MKLPRFSDNQDVCVLQVAMLVITVLAFLIALWKIPFALIVVSSCTLIAFLILYALFVYFPRLWNKLADRMENRHGN